MQLLVDENVHIDIIQGLRNAGHKVVSIVEVGLGGARDSVVLEYAIQHDLILISGDKDFGGLIEFGILWGKGKVFLLRYRIINIERTVQHIIRVLQREAEIISSKKAFVFVLSEGGYRIHTVEM